MQAGKARRAPKEGHNGRAGAAAAPPRLKLNGEQEAAVKIDSSVLVLSGAGTGKTRVITERIRHLIARRDARPERILALTFTNKAAREMRQRLVGVDSRDMFVGTFHSFGLRILRRFHEEAGLPADFGVIDGGDQFSIVKQLLAERRVPGVADKPNPGDIRHVIRDLQNRKDDRLDLSAIIGHGARIYDTHIRDPRALDDFLEAYETRLALERKVDFQDLIIRACELIQNNAAVRKALAGAYDHILIDELQDISADQLLMIGLLRARRTQYFGVGDDNQSIYRFRGANPNYMRYFRREFTSNRTTALTTNYRSKGEILELANAVIRRTKTPMFKSKRLRAHAGDGGAKPVLTGYENDQNEAQGVCDKVCALLADGVRADEICVLYRNHALSSLIEQAFHQRKVPFRIRGGMRFFERREVKDLLAYLHAAVNPNGREAVMRSINNPPRKIGEKMKRTLIEQAEAEGVGLWEVLAASDHKGVREYVGIVEQIRAAGGLIDQVKEAVTRSGLREHLQRQKDKERAENLNEVVNAAVRYGESDGSGLSGFLDSVALEAETDADGAKVAMMTIHAAKGLEYERVFIIGINTGILPRYESQNDDVEEDRRLLYVAITRAKEMAYLSYANNRMVFGSQQSTKLSFYLSGLEQYMDVEWGASAEMLTDDDRAEVNGSSFTVKDAVRSKKFGPGLILEISGNGDKAKALVKFKNHREPKWLVLALANLTRTA